MSFTLVFEGQIAAQQNNPLATPAGPFGVAVGASIGDSMAEAMTYYEALSDIVHTHDLAACHRLAQTALDDARAALDAEFANRNRQRAEAGK